MKELSKGELKELLNKCWMTHDGMWFYHCLQECGIEKTNKINKAAVKSLAAIESKRIKKGLSIQKVETFEELKDFIEGVFGVLKADFMDFVYSFPSRNLFHMEMRQCFAYDGMQRMGVIDQYQCGIFERIQGWFDGLEIKYSVTPQVEGCMMRDQGQCYRDLRFYFE
jgi:hypothetical protein